MHQRKAPCPRTPDAYPDSAQVLKGFFFITPVSVFHTFTLEFFRTNFGALNTAEQLDNVRLCYVSGKRILFVSFVSAT